jgi:hypothetical protein
MATQQTAQRPVKDYNCSEPELYAGLDMAWDSQEEYEPAFTIENTKYTAGLATTQKAAIQAARDLPDGQARYANSEDLRVTLGEVLQVGLGKWNSLDGYIKKAFKGEHYKNRIEEAGKQYYAGAYQNNWEVGKSLFQAGKLFLNTHNAVLLATGGMPTTFAGSFDTTRILYETTYANFMIARQQAQEQTDVKVLANNAIYQDGREMMEDGKHIFRMAPSTRERFIWERIMELVSPETGSGGATAVREADVAVNSVVDVDVADIDPSEDTIVIVTITGNPLRFSAAASVGSAPGATVWDVPIGIVTKTIVEFSALIGANDTNTFIKVQNLGPMPGHYKISFNNLNS